MKKSDSIPKSVFAFTSINVDSPENDEPSSLEKLTPPQVLDHLCKKKKGPLPKTNVPNFILIRFISMDESLLRIAIFLSRYTALPSDLFLRALRMVLPYRARGFGFYKYVKKVAIETNNELTPEIAKTFHTSVGEAIKLLEILNHTGVTETQLCSYFGLNKRRKQK